MASCSSDWGTNGETFEWGEVADIFNGKLIISGSDPYIDYRNGKMKFH